MIQAAQVASKFTLFTHHAKTFPDLVTALRNSMLRTGVFNNERTAEEQVVQVLNFDIHLVKDFRGRRYIERVTECIPIEEKNEYTNDYRNEKTLEGKFDKFFDNATIYFSKTTNRELYTYRNVLEFIDDKLVLSNPISDKNIKEMRLNMNDDDQLAFDAFLERNWGIKPPKVVQYDEDGNEITEAAKPKKVKPQISEDYTNAFVKSLDIEAGEEKSPVEKKASSEKNVENILEENLDNNKVINNLDNLDNIMIDDDIKKMAEEEIKKAEERAEKKESVENRAVADEEKPAANPKPQRRIIRNINLRPSGNADSAMKK